VVDLLIATGIAALIGGAFWLGTWEGLNLCRYNGHCLRPEYRKGRVSSVGVFPFCYWCSKPTEDTEHCTVIHLITDGMPELDRHISVHVNGCLPRTIDYMTTEGYPLDETGVGSGGFVL
jgi:hypothetical protein